MQPRHDLPTLQFAHQLCLLSYDDQADCEFFTVGDIRCGMFFDGNRIWIAVRGTANAENVARDVWILPKRTPLDYLGHKGVVMAYQMLLPHIKRRLRDMPNASIVCTGHSLGGGIAIILAERLNCDVITFGALKVYYRFFGTPLLKHTRVIRDDDPIPLLPGLRFVHDCDPVIIRDSDHDLLDLGDHRLRNYYPSKETLT